MDNIPGSFGSNNNRESNNQFDYEPSGNNERQQGSGVRRINFSSLSPERWVDVICCSLIVVFLIVVLCIWPTYSVAIFYNILFPIIRIGSKIVAVVATVAAGIGVLWIKLRRRRRFWW